MPALRIVVRPMDDSTFRVPDVLAVKADTVANLESVDSRSDIDVVGDEHGLSRLKLNDESLMSRPIKIVWQKPAHRALAFDLYVARASRERAADLVGRRRRTSTGAKGRTGRDRTKEQ